MIEKEIQENNKLIAEFMGQNNCNGIILTCTNQKNCCYGESPDCAPTRIIQYHTNWSWIMSVVEKIFKTPFEDVQGLREYSENPNTIFDGISYGLHSDIESIYYAVIKFIKWYNQNKK